MVSKKFVYLFSEGDASMKNLLGGKGANLAEMTKLKMPVPQGFTVTTEACTDYYDKGSRISETVEEQIFEHIEEIERINNKKFGDPNNPLLVSVRSGARASMPGMMDTILNLGINDEVAKGLIKENDTPEFRRFIYDSYRRFIQMFSDVVMEISKHNFETIIDGLKSEKGVKQDIELGEEDMLELVNRFKALYKKTKNEDFPNDPRVQLLESIKAVFRSWDNPRANVYRKMNDIPYDWGTAVNVQPMVFGNLNNNSGTGVAFTRNPATGEKQLFGEYLINAQGEDVVAGIRTPSPISDLEKDMPDVYKQFVYIANTLEDHYKDMQDMEFTIENGKLYMLQTRNGKRTAAAALKIAVDLVDEKKLSKSEAVMRIDPRSLDALLHPQFDQEGIKNAPVIGTGLAASPGAAAGKIVFTADDAKRMANEGHRVILVRLETSPEDIEGMVAAQGILTVRGGMTSHAAVVARGMGTCCVSGCEQIEMHTEDKFFNLGGVKYVEGDHISLDGSTGKIYAGDVKQVDASISGDFDKLMRWADSKRTMNVRTNADTPRDAKKAYEFGAEGIGLCRTEHMFFEADRIKAIREMIVSDTAEQRENALNKILPMQQGDFEELYMAMNGLPVTVRLLDPPLHEFLPTKEDDIVELAKELNITVEKLKAKIESLHEFNPMLGHRGCRLDVTYPEIAKMQTKAIIKAALAINKTNPQFNIIPEIMIPLVGEAKELKFVKDTITNVADSLIKESGEILSYKVGTMIEIPRACVVADEIAEEAEFFSFGTNDLTQMTFGFSRDDAAKFLDDYYATKIFEQDPFEKIDQKGVGKLMKNAVKLGRETRPDIKLGICGEHGGEPTSVEFCYKLGLNYVSCSPFRVPIARLAAAQASIKEEMARIKEVPELSTSV